MEHTTINIPIFFGTLSDLTKINLEFINAEIVIYKGTKFINTLKKLLPSDSFTSDYVSLTQDFDGLSSSIMEVNHTKRFAIIPIDVNKPFLDNNWRRFWEIMLCIYPSDLTIVEYLHLERQEDGFHNNGKSGDRFRASGESYFDNFLYVAKREYRFVNIFFKTYFSQSKKLMYVNYMLSVYSNSFRETSIIYQYISLIICMEVIVEGKEQLTYRLKRNVALICGDSVLSCELIYANINELYKLRSDIVHGHINPSYKNFSQYLNYLKMLVARLIRELIIHNIQSVSELNKKITALGFGYKSKISENYKSYKYPLLDTIKLSYTSVVKY